MTDHPEKPVEDWVTGDEPMTGPQRSYLETLAREAGAEMPSELTKAQASEEIERLQQITGRGVQRTAEADRSGPVNDADPLDGGASEDDEVDGHSPADGSLAERVEEAGVVDPQSVIVSDQETG